jgi:hypothetical protein
LISALKSDPPDMCKPSFRGQLPQSSGQSGIAS